MKASEFHLHTSINISARRSLFTRGSFYREKHMLGRAGRTSTKKPNSLNCWTLTPIEGCSENYVSFPPHLTCTILLDKAISSHFSKLDLGRSLWDLPTTRNSSDLVPRIAGLALEHIFWFWLQVGKILLQQKGDKNGGGRRLWKRWHIFFDKFIKDLYFPSLLNKD